MNKSLSAKQVLSISRNHITPGGIWADCVGEMDRHGVVFFWGNSGNGKTSAVMSFCRELCTFGSVLYISMEEGYSLSMQNTLRRFSMQDLGTKFQVIDHYNREELDERLSRQRSPEFIVFDSFQYTQMRYADYLKLKEKYRNKLLIFVSHAEGKQPAGRAAKSVKYDASLKIWVEGHVAFSLGRFIGTTGKAVIWADGCRRYWGTDDVAFIYSEKKDSNNNQTEK